MVTDEMWDKLREEFNEVMKKHEDWRKLRESGEELPPDDPADWEKFHKDMAELTAELKAIRE